MWLYKRSQNWGQHFCSKNNIQLLCGKEKAIGICSFCRLVHKYLPLPLIPPPPPHPPPPAPGRNDHLEKLREILDNILLKLGCTLICTHLLGYSVDQTIKICTTSWSSLTKIPNMHHSSPSFHCYTWGSPKWTPCSAARRVPTYCIFWSIWRMTALKNGSNLFHWNI